MGYIICTALVILVVVLCVRSIIRDHRLGGGSCNGDCGSCGGCGDQNIIVTVKKKKEQK